MTIIAGLRCDGLTEPWVIEGAMDGDAFEKYFKTQLAPTLEKRDVVIDDNLSAHKRDAAKQAIERRGAWLLFLPPYLTRLNSRSQSLRPTFSASNREPSMNCGKPPGQSVTCSSQTNVETSSLPMDMRRNKSEML